MASNFQIQKPYVLATLPRSLALPDSKSVVGEVYGQKPGTKKRRRPEVAVGIDGEAANLYDIASSRLITSYPVPPQARFSCAPCSLRKRSAASGKADVARYTYVSTQEPARKLTLFRDTVEASGATSSATVSTSLGRAGSAVVFMATTSTSGHGTSDAVGLAAPVLLTVAADGAVTFFDGETLEEKHKVSVAALSQELLPPGAALRVELAQMAAAGDVLKGLQRGEDYLSSILAPKVGTEADVLLLITAADGAKSTTRYVHVLVVDDSSGAAPTVQQVHHMRLPAAAAASTAAASYRLDVGSGTLFALEGEAVVAYDVGRSVPRVASRMAIAGVTSFLPLSQSSVLAATATTLAVYNPVFGSVQASTELEAVAADTSSRRTCTLAAYFAPLELVVALVDGQLVAVQLEPPRARSKKRRADGLLIDAIGRGVSRRAAPAPEERLPDSCLPGTVSVDYLRQYAADMQTADGLLAADDVAGFDDFLAAKLGIQGVAAWRWQRPLEADAEAEAESTTTALIVAETAGESDTAKAVATATAAARTVYPEADRRWVVYAIGRVLAVDQGPGRLRLRSAVPQSDILNYLADAGHLSVANARSALRASLADVEDAAAFLGEALPVALAHADPSLELLLRWLYATKLAAPELLSAILLLMRSLELVAEAEPKRLTNGGAVEDTTREDGTAESQEGEDASSADSVQDGLPQELDRLEQQLHVAEYFLEHVDNDPRDLALDMAIGKLGSCPSVATVLGLRRIFRTDEIRALIEVLRKQLVDQGWATRYVDMGDDDDHDAGDDDNDATTPLNYSIHLIADLLGRCIDAVQPGEWLANDVTAADGVADEMAEGPDAAAAVPAGDFFASLKWQVSAALEGVQEALYLRGILGEAVRYTMGVQAAAASAAASAAAAAAKSGELDKVRPTRVDKAAPTMLPLGLKAPSGLVRHDDVTATKIGAGGEVIKRSRREIGHLTSRKVGAYTLERIVL